MGTVLWRMSLEELPSLSNILTDNRYRTLDALRALKAAKTA